MNNTTSKTSNSSRPPDPKMTSFGDDYEQLENCGVDFDYTCFNNYDEDLGECEEGDEECFARYLQNKRASANPSTGYSTKSLSKSKLLKNAGFDKDADAVSRGRSSFYSRAANLSPSMIPPQPPPYFEGLPKDYYKKKYRPDYPTDLQMKQICASKPMRRRTTGLTRTQPKAIFIPSYTTLASQEQRNVLLSPSVAPTLRKSVAINSVRTSFTKVDRVNDIFTNDPSPLEQNRLPPPVISSSDEIVVDWIESYNVQMMFEYFLGLCVINQPDDPWIFISDLCSKMIEARKDLGAFDTLPRILTPEHSEAIFRIYDRIENGYITVSQYKSAMEAMGLNVYSTNPEGWEDDAISKDAFIQEATDAINNLLRTFMVFEDQLHQSSSQDLQKSATGKRTESFSGSGTSSSFSNSRSGTGTHSQSQQSPAGTAYSNATPLAQPNISFI